MLVGVTISGADKNTSVDDMRRLSAAYPFLEWALLVGGHRETERPRYPSDATLDAMMGAAQAAHLCGGALREVLDGGTNALRRFGKMRRIQLNAAGVLDTTNAPALRSAMIRAYAEPALRDPPTIIGQVMHPLDLLALETLADGFHVQPFFDGSGGRGRILSDEDITRYADMARGWTREHPKARGWMREREPPKPVVGFAGGITPDNVHRIVERIIKAYSGPFWIDMETGVRNGPQGGDDMLRIDLVERVLHLCEPFVPEALRRTSKDRERWWEREMFFGVGDLPAGDGFAPAPPAAPAPSGSGDFSIGGRVWPGASKVVEEAGELLQVLGKLMATHGNTTHFDGSDLRARLIDELADVEAAMRFFREVNLTPEERTRIETRGIEKHALFHAWHQEERAATCSDCGTAGTCRPALRP